MSDLTPDNASPIERKSNALIHRLSQVNWLWPKRILSAAFFIVVAYVVVSKGMEVEWRKVFETFAATPRWKLASGFLVGLLCYFAYASYDLIGRYLLRLEVHPLQVIWAGYISYASNLNFGALIGSVAFRYRLYSQLGVGPAKVTKILSISVATNWMGYLLLAGLLLASGVVELPQQWASAGPAIRLVGGLGLALVGGYVYLCVFSRRRELRLGGRVWTLPRGKLVIGQLLLACTHWTLMAAVIYPFFTTDVSFFRIYAILLASGLIGALAHIPGGLGVLEAVFVAFLAGTVPRYEVIAALFAYRCVFYLVPLAMALPGYLVFEAVHKNPGKSVT